MSSDAVIRASGLGKCYHIYERPEDRLKQILWRGRRTFYREFWALRDVAFEVRRGETVGIVGRNGSGKSTLLQLVCKTLTPSAGSVAVDGRLAALLELGSGFNPEFTGRENIYTYATVMGLTPGEIEARFPAIAAFADIGDFIEQPVKTYSNGMLVRVAFAVAAHVDPEILIVDEALSVGDMLFQFKCFLKFQELQESGKTILFVSHDMNTVKKYCSRALLLEGGRLVAEGGVNDIVNRYTRLLFPAGQPGQIAAPASPHEAAPAADAVRTSEREYRYGSGDGEIGFIALWNHRGESTMSFTAGERTTVVFRVIARRQLERPILAMTVKDPKGQEVYVTNTYYKGVPVPQLQPGDEIEVAFSQNLNLIPNTYFLSLGFVSLENGNIVPMDRRYDVVEIKVLARGGDLSTGIADLQSAITITAPGALSRVGAPMGAVAP
jgi:ABC-type polysaccharide/polyol phosphate transport system ATPase subunit